MGYQDEKSARSMGCGVSGAIAAWLLVVLAGCVTAPPPAETKRLVWPAPPLPTRIEFIRSIFSEEDIGRDATFNEKLAEFIAGKKPPANRIAEPMGLAVSDDGNRLYVSDYAQLAVFVFDFAQKSFTKIGREAPLGRPMGITLDAEENLYVAEQEKKGISVFNRRGEVIRFITDPSIERPGGVAIDRERGKIYLADTAHTKSETHSIKIFDLQGRLLGALGTGKGSAPGQLLFPTYVSVDKQGNVYVTDTLNSRVQVFDADGRYVKRFGERGNSWGMFDKPKGVATDSFGNVYVVDSGWSNVQIFNQKGQVLLFFGGRGPIPGMLQNPAPITIDKQNRIYVGDYLNHRVEVYQLVNTSADDSFIAPPAKPGAVPAGSKPETRK
ncbi:MAG: SMP-30/gluconolactonase/LRE family protein [Betaproteobacteria bacterium]|nr:SMP-30/gluconolactonase/LRE family protein [Betaproteobacteria bacterium]